MKTAPQRQPLRRFRRKAEMSLTWAGPGRRGLHEADPVDDRAERRPCDCIAVPAVDEQLPDRLAHRSAEVTGIQTRAAAASGPVQRRRQPRTCRGRRCSFAFAAVECRQSHDSRAASSDHSRRFFYSTPGCPRAAEQVWMRCTVADNAAQTRTGWHCWGRGMLHMSVLDYVACCLMLHLELSKRAPDGTARGWAAASTLAAPRR